MYLCIFSQRGHKTLKCYRYKEFGVIQRRRRDAAATDLTPKMAVDGSDYSPPNGPVVEKLCPGVPPCHRKKVFNTNQRPKMSLFKKKSLQVGRWVNRWKMRRRGGGVLGVGGWGGGRGGERVLERRGGGLLSSLLKWRVVT